jgi:O-antigen ligase
MLTLKRREIRKFFTTHLAQLFFCCFIFFASFNVSTVFHFSETFLSGFFSPYLSFSFYLPDLFFILSCLFLGKRILRTCSSRFLLKSFFVFFTLSLISFFLAQSSLVVLSVFLRLVQFFLFALILSSSLFERSKLIWTFLSSVFFISLVAIVQFLMQSSLGLSFLGEPFISSDSLTTAKINLAGLTLLRPYAFSLHPNILAGFIVIALFFLFDSSLIRGRGYLKKIMIPLLLFALLITFSRSAILAFFFSYLFAFRFKGRFKLLIYLFILFFVFSSFFIVRSGVAERIELILIAKNAFFSSPFFGVGLGNFTYLIQDFSLLKLSPWEFQPVHNIYLLVLAEIGLLGFIAFSLFLKKIFVEAKKSPKALRAAFASILIIGIFDHYLLTLYPGQFLTFFVAGLILQE